MTKTDHLAKAKDYIAKGEDYYRKAAEEIFAERNESDTSWREIGRRVGRDESWCRRLVQWYTNAAGAASGPSRPFAEPGRERDRAADAAKQVIRERPEAIAEVIAQAPPEAQRKIADKLIQAPTTEPSLRKVAEPTKRKPREQKAPEQKLSEAVFALWEVGEMLLDAAPSGEQRVRMTALAEKAERLAGGILHLIGTGQLEDEFAELVREVGAES